MRTHFFPDARSYESFCDCRVVASWNLHRVTRFVPAKVKGPGQGRKPEVKDVKLRSRTLSMTNCGVNISGLPSTRDTRFGRAPEQPFCTKTLLRNKVLSIQLRNLTEQYAIFGHLRLTKQTDLDCFWNQEDKERSEAEMNCFPAKLTVLRKCISKQGKESCDSFSFFFPTSALSNHG